MLKRIKAEFRHLLDCCKVHKHECVVIGTAGLFVGTALGVFGGFHYLGAGIELPSFLLIILAD